MMVGVDEAVARAVRHGPRPRRRSRYGERRRRRRGELSSARRTTLRHS
ncbi:hypothetical protein STRTUCAR8_00155 [Streptomyces turgidiscabies Car8]|uniref:Uncharacterized protein n=1 Tax=Streptomyces turgidiscabies (strain Car8) TaxID=698760 RepID=L7EZ31_STRT8|nr:hypothetical protein STRTUCAR8_00155 [Streptomyces turgidiscabies Car8]